MPGRAHTPSGYEPNLHGELTGPHDNEFGKARQALDDFYKVEMEQRAKGEITTTYKEQWEYLKRGEGDLLGHYVYEQMFDIYAGIEDEVLEGCVDTHLHIYPDYVPRTADVIRMAIRASKCGYRAILCKDHFFTNVGMCWAAQWVCEDMVRRGELKHACQVLGTHNLAWSFHPDQINLIRKYPNLGGVFFPTMTGTCFNFRQAGPPLPIIDAKGKLMTEVEECIAAMAEYHICVLTGHRNYAETAAMVEYGHKVGAHLLLTHAGGRMTPRSGAAGTIEQAKELVKLGAWIEWQLDSVTGGGGLFPINDMSSLTKWIKAMGPECVDYLVCGSDLGQPSAVEPIEGTRIGIRMLLHSGISMEDVKKMFQKNGGDAIYLDEKETNVWTPDQLEYYAQL